MSGRPTRRGRRRSPLVSLRFPSETALLSLVKDLAAAVAHVAGFDEAGAERISVAVDEAASNVIEHAYGGEPGRPVEIRLALTTADLVVELFDSGKTVDPRAMPRVDLTLYASERRTGGLGVHLMERIMDSVTFSRSARRNVCRMVKRRPAPPQGG